MIPHLSTNLARSDLISECGMGSDACRLGMAVRDIQTCIGAIYVERNTHILESRTSLQTLQTCAYSNSIHIPSIYIHVANQYGYKITPCTLQNPPRPVLLLKSWHSETRHTSHYKKIIPVLTPVSRATWTLWSAISPVLVLRFHFCSRQIDPLALYYTLAPRPRP